MKNLSISKASRLVVLNVCDRMDDYYIELGDNVNKQMLDIMIEIAICEEGLKFESEKALGYFTQAVLKQIRKDCNFLFSKFYKNINDRLLL